MQETGKRGAEDRQEQRSDGNVSSPCVQSPLLPAGSSLTLVLGHPHPHPAPLFLSPCFFHCPLHCKTTHLNLFSFSFSAFCSFWVSAWYGEPRDKAGLIPVENIHDKAPQQQVSVALGHGKCGTEGRLPDSKSENLSPKPALPHRHFTLKQVVTSLSLAGNSTNVWPFRQQLAFTNM